MPDVLHEVLHERRATLDGRSAARDRWSAVDSDLAHFIQVLSWVTPPGNPRSHGPRLRAAVADEIMAESQLLRRLRERAPVITDGPLLPSEQFWVSTGDTSRRRPRVHDLNESRFVDSDHLPEGLASTKPFGMGLYTSTGVFGTFGMWLCYLELNRGSSLFPLPWTVWSLEIDPGARVLEINTATAWVEFVALEPVRRHGLLHPNWKAAGNRWDGVHMTISAIAATQGVAFVAGSDVVAPTYWDVESTLWLRWSFTTVEKASE
jgi:hypothetical protein